MSDPVSGPLSRQRLKELADLPYGKAKGEIQLYDPLWGQTEYDREQQLKRSRDYREARLMHALHLKSEGLKLVEVGKFLGVKAKRAGQMVRQARVKLRNSPS